MPLELLVTSPRRISFGEYADRPPAGDEVLIETVVSGIKHGTELNIYRGTLPFAEELWDPQLRLFRPPGAGERVEPFYPKTLGSWAAGVVVAVGPDAQRFRPGDCVHGEWKHRQTALRPEATLYPVEAGVDPDAMVFTDPARFALAAVHDAAIKLGDRVAIFGMGAIGLLAVQMARLSGADYVCVVDPVVERRQLAEQLGADLALDPAAGDTGLAIKRATGGVGVDVALEISGVYAALQHAVRCVRREGRVVTASYYGEQRGQVDFSREWHHNRITLLSSMPVWSCTHRSHPLWDLARLEQTAVRLLASGRLQVRPIIGTRVPFEHAAEAYDRLDHGPDASAKVLLTYAA
jgi:2-desacetyl-2-hydroxyethyl bacteriochlorophyllide A dehydrogenase